MTLRARDVGVLPRERILRSLVVERRRVFPFSGIVAARARAGQAAAMRIGVTARALALEPYPLGPRAGRSELHRRCGLQTHRMTRRALRRRMALLERIARATGMIESVAAPARPLDEREVAPRVVRVTARAVTTRFDPRMKATTLLLERGDLAMTCEAPLRRGLLATAVAPRAVRRALERRVRPGERAGRDLRAKVSHVGQRTHDRDRRERQRACQSRRQPESHAAHVSPRSPPGHSPAAPW